MPYITQTFEHGLRIANLLILFCVHLIDHITCRSKASMPKCPPSLPVFLRGSLNSNIIIPRGRPAVDLESKKDEIL
jgi:hypothetical protein